MREITSRLHENRQIELAKDILESAGYRVEKINETFYNDKKPRWVLWFGQWMRGNNKAFTSESELRKFLDTHYVEGSTDIAYVENVTAKFKGRYNTVPIKDYTKLPSDVIDNLREYGYAEIDSEVSVQSMSQA